MGELTYVQPKRMDQPTSSL